MEDSTATYLYIFPPVRYPRFVRSDNSVYWIALLLRFFLTLLPQTGYIHPDEFFQSTEIAIGDIFNVENSRPWEFKISYPVRSICPIHIVLGAPLYLLKILAEFCDIDIKSPYALIVIPRLIFCLLSLVTDYSLYRICKLEGEKFRIRLLILSTSYVMLIYATRTFSNSIEMALVSYLIYYVVVSMKITDRTIESWERLNVKFSEIVNLRERIQLKRRMNHLPSYQYQGVLPIALILVMGTFNRPTFLAFAVPPVFFWLYRGLGTRHVTLYHYHMRLLLLVLAALPFAAIFILTDSIYFGKTNLQALLDHNLYLGYSFVVAPYNFFKYNIDARNLAKHGLHPRITHALVNVPLLYNVLAGVAFLSVLKLFNKVLRKQWTSLPRIQSVHSLMLLSLLTPLCLLSIFPHQEPRFLLPITLPIVYLYASYIYGDNWGMQEQPDGSYVLSQKLRSSGSTVSVSGKLIRLWFLCNMIMTLMFGFLHQAGVYSMTKYFTAEVQSKLPGSHIHLVTSYTYTMPLSLMGTPSYANTLYTDKKGKKYRKSQDFFKYELGSATASQICTKLSTLLDQNEQTQSSKKIRHKTFLALPGSRVNFLNHTLCSGLDFSEEWSIFPSVTMEALPRLIPTEDQCPYISLWENPLQMLGSLLGQFRIILVQVRHGKRAQS